MRITEYRLVQYFDDKPHCAMIKNLTFQDMDGTEYDIWDEEDTEAQERLEAFLESRDVRIVERIGERRAIIVQGDVEPGEPLTVRFGGMQGMSTADHRIEES